MLVDYSDSGSDDSDQACTPNNRTEKGNGDGGGSPRKRKAEPAGHQHVQAASKKSKPPPPRLPASFHSLYATNVRTAATDDPTLHAGRTRQIPHVAGNWPTHVYLEWAPSKSEIEVLNEVLRKVTAAASEEETTTLGSSANGNGSGNGNASSNGTANSNTIAGGSQPQLHSFLRSELGTLLPLHVSLSAPLVLKTDQKAAFQECLASKVSRSHVKPFTVEVTGLDWVANQDRSRFFLVLRLKRPDNDELNVLLSECNAVARQFGLPTLYDDDDDGEYDHNYKAKHGRKRDRSDAFHISIAWTLQVPANQGNEKGMGKGKGGGQLLGELVGDDVRGLKVRFSLLKLKIGSTVTDLPFVKR